MKISIILGAAVFAVVTALPNKENVMKAIEEINRAQSSWKAEYTEISALSDAEFQKLLGADIPSNVHTLRRRLIKPRDDIPASFDAREQWSECDSISSVKDQGHCGDCWAVSTAGAASDRLCIGSDYNTKVNLSALNLMSCCSECTKKGGCHGGNTLKAWRYIKNTGLVTGGDYGSEEGCQPYSIRPTGVALKEDTPPCENECTNSDYGTSYNDDLHYGTSAYLLEQDVSQIQTDLMNNGPAVVSFTVYEDFKHYKSGVYVQNSDVKKGGHAVRLIGWGTDEASGLDYWLAANSWSRRWGDNGLFKIRRGTNECGFEHYITAGLIS